MFREVFGDVARFAADAAELAELLALAITEPDPRRADGGRALAAGYPWSAAARAHLRLYREVC
ncbi:MAG: hypothetical protein ACRDQ5_26305 [Sciscionella sp.]